MGKITDWHARFDFRVSSKGEAELHSMGIQKITAITAYAALISGCSSTPQIYVAPLSGSLASITFANLAENPVSLNGYQNAEDCSGGTIVFGARQKLNPGATVTINTATSEAFSFRYYRNEMDGFCSTILTFSPEGDQDYIAYFDDGGGANLCLAGINAPSGDVDYEHRIDLVRNTTAMLVGNGMQCN